MRAEDVVVGNPATFIQVRLTKRGDIKLKELTGWIRKLGLAPKEPGQHQMVELGHKKRTIFRPVETLADPSEYRDLLRFLADGIAGCRSVENHPRSHILGEEVKALLDALHQRHNPDLPVRVTCLRFRPVLDR